MTFTGNLKRDAAMYFALFENDVDFVNELLLFSVRNDAFGAPICIDSIRRFVNVVEALYKICCDFEFVRFELQFLGVFNQATGVIYQSDDLFPDTPAFDILAYKKDGDDDVSVSV